MEYGAIDLHKKESQIRIVTTSGEVIDRRIPTSKEGFQTVFWGRAPMRLVVCMESPPPENFTGTTSLTVVGAMDGTPG